MLVISSTPAYSAAINLSALTARLTALEAASQAREARIVLLQEENRWLKSPPRRLSFPHTSARSAADKICASDGTALERIGEEIAEQLDFKPAQIRVLRHIRPKYACPCCRQGVKIAPVPLSLFPKSLATPALLAHITTAKFVDGLPLYRQETQFARLGVTLGRATMANWMIRLSGTHVVPLINLLAERMLEAPLIHCDETPPQVLHCEKSPTSDHYLWVRPPGRPAERSSANGSLLYLRMYHTLGTTEARSRRSARREPEKLRPQTP